MRHHSTFHHSTFHHHNITHPAHPLNPIHHPKHNSASNDVIYNETNDTIVHTGRELSYTETENNNGFYGGLGIVGLIILGIVLLILTTSGE